MLYRTEELEWVRLFKGIRTERQVLQPIPEFFAPTGCQTRNLEVRARDNIFECVSGLKYCTEGDKLNLLYDVHYWFHTR
jgi:hypothetical protein